MTSDYQTCVLGCEDADENGNLTPRLAIDAAMICEPCLKRLSKSLTDIRDHYPELRKFLTPGTTPTDDDIKRTPRPTAPIPVRLAVVDLTDERHVTTAYGPLRAAENVRGAVGRLQYWANFTRERRGQRTLPHPTIGTETLLLSAHLPWIAAQSWVSEFATEIYKLRREILDTIGVMRAKPLARCTQTINHTVDGHTMPEICRGPIFQFKKTVMCVRCRTVWASERLAKMSGLNNTSVLRVPEA